MKLRSLLLLTIFLNISNVYAQTTLPEFAPHGAHWTYESIDRGPTPDEHDLAKVYVLDHDTMIEGYNCRICVDQGQVLFYCYRDSLKVFVHSGSLTQHWQLAYDFGWTAGDTVYIPIIYTAQFDSSKFVIKQRYDTVINGITLPALKLISVGMFSGISITAIMNIGAVNDFFIPDFGARWILEYGGTTVRCYQDTVIGTYTASGVVSCDTLPAAVPFMSTSNDIQLHPNPTTDIVHLSNIADVTSLQLLSIDGRIVQNITTPTPNITVSSLPNGICIAVLHLKDGSVQTKRLIKH